MKVNPALNGRFVLLFLWIFGMTTLAGASDFSRNKNILLLGPSESGKLILLQSLLDKLMVSSNEQVLSSAVDVQFNHQPSTKGDRSPLSQEITGTSIIKTRLAEGTDLLEPRLELSEPNVFERYYHGLSKVSVIYTPSIDEKVNVGDFSDKLSKSLKTLLSVEPAHHGQVVVFIKLTIADFMKVLGPRESGFSKDHSSQMNRLKSVIENLPDENMRKNITFVIHPDYSETVLSENEAMEHWDVLDHMKKVVNAQRSNESKLISYLSSTLNTEANDAKLYVLDLEAPSRWSDNVPTNCESSKRLVEAIISKGGQPGSRTGQQSLLNSQNTKDLNDLGVESMMLKTKLNELKERQPVIDSGNGHISSRSLETLPEKTETVQAATFRSVAEESLSRTDKTMTINAKCNKNEVELTTFSIGSLKFGLNENNLFTFEMSEGPQSSILDTNKIPKPTSVKSRLQNKYKGTLNTALVYEIEFDDRQVVFEYLNGDKNSFSGLSKELVNGYVPFHRRGVLKDLYANGTDGVSTVELKVLVDQFEAVDSINKKIRHVDQMKLLAKKDAVSQYRDVCELGSANCKLWINESEELQQNMTSYDALYTKCLESFKCQQGVDPNLCYDLMYQRANDCLPENFSSFNDEINSIISNQNRQINQYEKVLALLDKQSEGINFDEDHIVINKEVFTSRLAKLLSKELKQQLEDIEEAFKNGEVISFEKDNKVHYRSSKSDVLVKIFNLLYVPVYKKFTEHENVAPYLDPGNSLYDTTMFSLEENKGLSGFKKKAKRDLNILVVGLQGSGKSTFSNFANHVASTIDHNRLQESLNSDESFHSYTMTRDDFSDTWVGNYFPRELNSGYLRAIIKNRLPNNSGFTSTYNTDVEISNERNLAMGTGLKGNFLDSIESQAPFILPDFRVRILDASGYNNKFNVDRISQDRVISMIEKDLNMVDKIHGVCLVIDLETLLLDMPVSGQNIDSIRLSNLRYLNDVFRDLKMPVNIVLTHKGILENFETHETKKRIKDIKDLLDSLFGIRNIFAFEFGSVFGGSSKSSESQFDKSYRSSIYEMNKLFNTIFDEDKSIKLEEFKETVESNLNNKRRFVKIKGSDLEDNIHLIASATEDMLNPTKISIENPSLEESIKNEIEKIEVEDRVKSRGKKLQHLVMIGVDHKKGNDGGTFSISKVQVWPLYAEFEPSDTSMNAMDKVKDYCLVVANDIRDYISDNEHQGFVFIRTGEPDKNEIFKLQYTVEKGYLRKTKRLFVEGNYIINGIKKAAANIGFDLPHIDNRRSYIGPGQGSIGNSDGHSNHLKFENDGV